MTELATELATAARRRGLVAALHECPLLTIDQLRWLVERGEHRLLLGDITVAELLSFGGHEDRRFGESPTDAILRICHARRGEWLASSEFRGATALPRWSLQALLGELVGRGLLERRGVTSKTRYRVVVTDDSSEPER